jgi:hypothetical protein
VHASIVEVEPLWVLTFGDSFSPSGANRGPQSRSRVLLLAVQGSISSGYVSAGIIVGDSWWHVQQVTTTVNHQRKSFMACRQSRQHCRAPARVTLQ